ncbi:MAG: hypothetical protein ABIH59_02765 [archaeon]
MGDLESRSVEVSFVNSSSVYPLKIVGKVHESVVDAISAAKYYRLIEGEPRNLLAREGE